MSPHHDHPHDFDDPADRSGGRFVGSLLIGLLLAAAFIGLGLWLRG